MMSLRVSFDLTAKSLNPRKACSAFGLRIWFLLTLILNKKGLLTEWGFVAIKDRRIGILIKNSQIFCNSKKESFTLNTKYKEKCPGDIFSVQNFN